MKATTKVGIGAATGAAGLSVKPVRRMTRKAATWSARHLHHLQGRGEGMLYRATGRHPDPDVSDDVLADRMRSELGRLTHALDLPHVHVTVTDHVVTLHGDVATATDAYDIEAAAEDVSGVEGVVSLLHEGLLRSDARPSEGALHQKSPAARGLLGAARKAGCPERAERAAVRSVLACFFEHVSDRECVRLTAQLPADVKRLAAAPRRSGHTLSCLHPDLDGLVSSVSRLGSLPNETAHDVVVAVLRELRQLLPDEGRDIQGELPTAIRDVWAAAPLIGTD